MHACTIVLASAAGLSACIVGSARGGFGPQMVFHGTVQTAAGPRDVYRLYFNFSAPNDRVLSWGAVQQTGSPVDFHTGICHTAPGSPFFQAGGSNRAPSQDAIDNNPDVQWDTFATIGVSIAEQGVPFDQTQLTPGFPTFINGNSFLSTSARVFVPMNSPQARADFAGDGDPQLRVLLAQLTVQPHDFPFGSIGSIEVQSGGITQQWTNVSWVPLTGFGRCCLPAGSCVLSTDSDCALYLNGFFLNCQPCDACELTCLADIAPHPGDGEVNVDDLLAVIEGWGDCSPWDTCPPDVSPAPAGNDQVNVDDLLVVISNWGPCR